MFPNEDLETHAFMVWLERQGRFPTYAEVLLQYPRLVVDRAISQHKASLMLDTERHALYLTPYGLNPMFSTLDGRVCAG
jgi:hypothetical protein